MIGDFAPPCMLPMPEVSQWETPVGEILFFKKPKAHLDVEITFDKEVYAPGDTVNFEVSVSDDAYASVFVTDDSVFYQLD